MVGTATDSYVPLATNSDSFVQPFPGQLGMDGLVSGLSDGDATAPVARQRVMSYSRALLIKVSVYTPPDEGQN